ncbi:SusD/RagB family nutrient-binding outer membrane lipoprotein [Prevotella sp. SGI.027]
MKKYILIVASLLATFGMTSCLDDFQDLNTDKEKLPTATPVNAFAGATLNFNNCSRSHLLGKYSGTMTYMQYIVPAGGPSAGTYISRDKTGRTEPYAPAYTYYYTANGDNFGGFGLRLDYLITQVIPVQNEPERFADIGAIAKMLLSYEQWLILDTYGAAPLTEGLKAQTERLTTPKYDLYQKAIDGTPMYKKLDAMVKECVATLKASNDKQVQLKDADFFYGGDIAKWIKFGNTLRVKMAQRLEKADKAFYNSVIDEVLTSPDNVIGSYDESCIYHHPNDYNNNTDDIQDITSRYVASRAFVAFLETYDDPRLPILVRRNGFGTGNNNKENDDWFDTFKKEYPNYKKSYKGFIDRYVGASANPDSATSEYSRNAYMTLPYHKEDGTEANLEIRMNSQVESRFFVKNGGIRGNNNMPARAIEDTEFMINQDKMSTFTPIITYSETCLMLAEIALKKGGAVAGKDAKAWYREGVKASMEQFRAWATNMWVTAQVNDKAANYNPITDEKIAAYLDRPEFQNVTLEKIISQQWVNLFVQPEEMWATWKRTGYPKFKDQPVPEDGAAFLESIKSAGTALVIPRRNSLPVPNDLNIDNYNQAVSALKNDAKYGADVDKTEGRIWWDQ